MTTDTTTPQLDTRPVTVPVWALDQFLSYAAADGHWDRISNPHLGEAWDELITAKDAALGHEPAPPAAPAEPPLPAGQFARIELPGYRNHTGWVAEETRFGAQTAVVRDWDGHEVAAVALGPGCQVLFLPTPLRRPDPEPLAALPAASHDGYYPEDYFEDVPAPADEPAGGTGASDGLLQ